MADKLEIIIEATDRASSVIKGIGTNMGDAGKKASGFSSGITSAAKSLATYALAGGAAIKATELVSDFFKSSINDTMDYAKAVRDVARYTGTSAEESSKFLQIADDLQIETQTLKTGFRFLNKEGIQPTIENIKDLAIEYQSFKDPVDKATFAMEKFGTRSGMEMAKILEMTSEQIDEIAQSAENLGLVLDDQAIAKTEEYRLAVDNLNDAWQGVKTTVGMAVIPALSKMATSMNVAMTEQAAWNKLVAMGLPNIEEYDKRLWEGESAVGLYNEALRKAGLGLEDLYNKSKDAGFAISDTTEEMTGFTLWGNKVAESSEYTAEATRHAIKAFEDYQATLAASGDIISQTLAAEADNAYEAARIATDLAAARGDLTAEGVKEAEQNLQLLKNARDLSAAYQDKQVSYTDYIKATADGVVTQGELNDAMGETPVYLSDIQKATGISAEKWGEYATKSLAAVQNTDAELVTAEGLIRGIISAWAGVPAFISTKYDIYINTHGGGAFEGDVYGDKGGIPFVQEGGPVSANRPYIVGEVGPELFIPNSSGRIVPNNQLNQYSIGDINIHPAQGTNGAQLVDEFMAEIGRRARGARISGTRFVG